MTTNTIIADAVKQGRNLLTEIESKQILREAGIDTVTTKLAGTQAAAVALAGEMGFPVVLKISSADITHKSDAGGVKVGLKGKEAVRKAYREIMDSARQKFPKAKIEGVSVQPMARQGIEVIIGMTKDPQFGPVMMFGLGGILVEVLKDVSFRIIPLERRDAAEMIREIKGFPLLQGYRSQEPADLPFLEDLLLKLSAFIDATPEIKELDLNPVFAYKDGGVAVDARIVLEEKS